MPEIIDQRYQLKKLLGTGGTGEVWLATDLRLKRRVAIKRANEKRRGHSKVLERLLKEAELLAQVDHSNVVMVHDILESETSVAIILEFVRGQPFIRLFRKRALPEERFLTYFRQLLAALEAVHAVGIVHRDVNPRNVLVTREDVVKLTDFGLSGLESDDRHRPGGTLAYMAPEMLRKQPNVSAAADIYSLGFMAYQALLGVAAFKKLYGATRPKDWMRFVLSREPFKSLRELDVPVSTALNEIVARMLEKDPAARYRKISSVRRDFEERLLDSEQLDDAPSSVN